MVDVEEDDLGVFPVGHGDDALGHIDEFSKRGVEPGVEMELARFAVLRFFGVLAETVGAVFFPEQSEEEGTGLVSSEYLFSVDFVLVADHRRIFNPIIIRR